jgi:murein DD-endopeptidase MepM/ murein hydrolase activator NlpD
MLGVLGIGDVTDERHPPHAVTSSTLPPGARFGAFRPNQGPNGTFHWGVDIPGKPGDDVTAPEDMVVVHVWTTNVTPPFAGYGPAGLVARGEHSGRHHLLAHLDPKVWVDVPLVGDARPRVGQRFALGERVGVLAPLDVGSHVHWEVRREPVDSPQTRAQNTLDPLVWLAGVDLPGVPPGARSPEPPKRESGSGTLVVLFLIALALTKG